MQGLKRKKNKVLGLRCKHTKLKGPNNIKIKDLKDLTVLFLNFLLRCSGIMQSMMNS